jgi:hypothetical protein
MTDFAFSLRHNARLAAEKRLASGTAPGAAYTIEPAEGGRFAIAWQTEPAAETAPVETPAISEHLAGPDDPIYSEPARSYSPHWSRGFLTTRVETPAESAPAEAEAAPAEAAAAEDAWPAGTRVTLTGTIESTVDGGWFVLVDGVGGDPIFAPSGSIAAARRQPRGARSTPGSPRPGKAREADEAAARGVTPAKPDVTSHANAHYQKRFDRLAELAASGDWNGVAAYQCNGVNTYAKMVRQYRDRLLTAHRATTSATEAA